MKNDRDGSLKSLLSSSALLHSFGWRKADDFPQSLFDTPIRALSPDEIGALQNRGNSAESWDDVLVAGEIDPAFIVGNTFFGRCIIGGGAGTKAAVDEGIVVATGLYRTTFIDAVLGANALVYEAGTVARYIIRKDAVIYGTKGLICKGESTFGNGLLMAIGNETGGREVAACADADFGILAKIALHRGDTGLQRDYQNAVSDYCARCRSRFGVVEAGVIVRYGTMIVNAYIGRGAIIDNALLVENATILSHPDERTVIRDGAYVRNSCMQRGSEVASMAIVDRSILCEHSSARRHAKVTDCIVGPNTEIAEGEVTSSLVGPFVGFHHQSLLIAALWPEGKGNIGYGANVGSNHTGKAPDQEIRCGEGLFFGLGANIKYPADYSESPYTIIATGVDCMPQKLSMPFSLVNKSMRSDAPPLLNELFPGWMLIENLYALFRNESKYRQRNKSRSVAIEPEIFRPSIVDLVVDARRRLKGAGGAGIYFEKDIPGAGKNYIAERSRRGGIAAYQLAIEYYCLGGLYDRVSAMAEKGVKISEEGAYGVASARGFWLHQAPLFSREGYHERSLTDNLLRFAEIAALLAEKVKTAKSRDDGRGALIMRDYKQVHVSADGDALSLIMQQRAGEIREATEKLCSMIPARDR